MVFERTDRKFELAGNKGGCHTLGFEPVGGIEVNLNRLAARHSRGLQLWMCVDSTGVYFGGRLFATLLIGSYLSFR